MNTNTPAIELRFPATWRAESIATFQRLADAGKVDQTEIDRVEEQLVWFRAVRDEYANGTTISREQ